ncbi:MAG: ATP-binding protein [Chthoniobacterales bacterium]
MMKLVAKICDQCGKHFEYESACWESGPRAGREILSLTSCLDCHEARCHEYENQNRALKSHHRVELWNRICPPQYRSTDVLLLPATYRDVIAEWTPETSSGIGFVGSAGIGKTRAAFLLLKKSFDTGVPCQYINAVIFNELVVQMFSDSKERRHRALDTLHAIRTSRVLLFDDLGKGKLTERAETELYSLLEHRTSRQLPTHWTANSNGEELLSRMSPDRGEPILRRLAEFSRIV